MIARVFPRKTKASPTDELAFFAGPPLRMDERVSEVHVSCAFTYDLPRAYELAKQWESTELPIRVG